MAEKTHKNEVFKNNGSRKKSAHIQNQTENQKEEIK